MGKRNKTNKSPKKIFQLNVKGHLSHHDFLQNGKKPPLRDFDVEPWTDVPQGGCVPEPSESCSSHQQTNVELTRKVDTEILGVCHPIEQAFLKGLKNLRLLQNNRSQRYFSNVTHESHVQENQQDKTIHREIKKTSDQDLIQRSHQPNPVVLAMIPGETSTNPLSSMSLREIEKETPLDAYHRMPSPISSPHEDWFILRCYHLSPKNFKKRHCPFCYLTSHTKYACPSLQCRICGGRERCRRGCASLRLFCTVCFCLRHSSSNCPLVLVNQSLQCNSMSRFLTKSLQAKHQLNKKKKANIKRLCRSTGMTCIMCCRTGHACCPSKKVLAPKSGVYCSHCGHSGHDVFSCPKRIQSKHNASTKKWEHNYDTLKHPREFLSPITQIPNLRTFHSKQRESHENTLLSSSLQKSVLKKELKHNRQLIKAKVPSMSSGRQRLRTMMLSQFHHAKDVVLYGCPQLFYCSTITMCTMQGWKAE